MKTIIAITALWAISLCAVAQKVQVPAAVQQAFGKDFAGAKANAWEMDGELYEVEFKQSGHNLQALYNAQGALQATEQTVSKSLVPATVLSAFATTRYASWKVDEYEKVMLPNGQTQYEVEVKQGKETMSLLFGADGKLLKEQKE